MKYSIVTGSAPHLAPHQHRHTENTESNSFKSVFAFSHSGFFVFKTIFMEFVISILTREFLKVFRTDECVKTLISVDRDHLNSSPGEYEAFQLHTSGEIYSPTHPRAATEKS